MINCKFSCSKCGADKVPFQVRYRLDNESIEHYIKQTVGRACNLAHAKHNLLCDNNSVDLMVESVGDGEHLWKGDKKMGKEENKEDIPLNPTFEKLD